MFEIGCILIAFIVFGVAVVGVGLLDVDHQFEYTRNPFRRICKTCEQQQDKYDWSWNNALSYQTGWWEDTGQTIDSNCDCHKYSTYKSLI